MTTETRKLYRSKDDRMLAGVCGGLAEYFKIDATVVRLLFVIGTVLGGPGLLAYIICLVLMPLEPEVEIVESGVNVQESA
jgi:phage shock protein C